MPLGWEHGGTECLGRDREARPVPIRRDALERVVPVWFWALPGLGQPNLPCSPPPSVPAPSEGGISSQDPIHLSPLPLGSCFSPSQASVPCPKPLSRFPGAPRAAGLGSSSWDNIPPALPCPFPLLPSVFLVSSLPEAALFQLVLPHWFPAQIHSYSLFNPLTASSPGFSFSPPVPDPFPPHSQPPAETDSWEAAIPCSPMGSLGARARWGSWDVDPN